ncbi:MAG TPA: hypothetical protein VMX17_17535 [Candidatus Glassbacteria bacterium]|nr:hypothetical protein [Candidatus Glassbacteria bacterium]
MDKGDLQVLVNLIQLKTYCVTMYGAPTVDKETYRMLQEKVKILDKQLLLIISELEPKNLQFLSGRYLSFAERDEQND